LKLVSRLEYASGARSTGKAETDTLAQANRAMEAQPDRALAA
jgi:hypothetical protein